MKSEVAKFPSELVIEIFKEEFGDYDLQDRAGKVANEQNQPWSEGIVFGWTFHGLYVVIIKNERKNPTFYYEIHRESIKKRVDKVISRVKLEDVTWTIRKILSSYSDTERLKRHELAFRNSLLLVGLSIGIIGVSLSILDIEFTWITTLIDLLLVGLTWWSYRKGIENDAVDIRFFSVTLFYTFILNGIPLSFVAAYIGFIVPIDGLFSLLIFIALPILITVNYIELTYLVDPYIQPKLRALWSEIRVDIENPEHRAVQEFPPLETRLNTATLLSYPSAFSISQLLTVISLFAVWTIRILGNLWYIGLVVIPIFIIMFNISWRSGHYFGRAQIKKALNESGPYHIKIGSYVVLIMLKTTSYNDDGTNNSN